MGAAGGLGKILIFSQSKGRAYAKQWKKPSNPKTRPQVAMRAIAAFLAHDWTNLAQAIKDTWIDQAQNRNISPYNAYLSANIARWRDHLAPSWTPSAIGVGPQATMYAAATIAVARGIRYRQYVNIKNAGWPALLYRVDSFGQTKRWDYLIAALAIPTSGYVEFTWPVSTPGTYYFAISKAINTGGLWSGQDDRGVTWP